VSAIEVAAVGGRVTGITPTGDERALREGSVSRTGELPLITASRAGRRRQWRKRSLSMTGWRAAPVPGRLLPSLKHSRGG